MFYDQENDDQDNYTDEVIDDRTKAINNDWLTGWSVAQGKKPITNGDINYIYDNWGQYVGIGFEEGARFYNDSHLDVGSFSDNWWRAFHATAQS